MIMMDEQEAWQQRLRLVRQEIPNLFTLGETVLYVGATPQRFQLGRELFDAGYEITLLEAFKHNADHYQDHPWLKDVICGDVRDITEIASGCKWDVVVWWHGPEHVAKEGLATVLADLGQVANKLVLLGCPWGINRQGVVGGNFYSVHWSSLETSDLATLGYETATLGEKDNPSTWCHIMAWRFKGD